MARAPLTQRFKQAGLILRGKSFIPPLPLDDGFGGLSGSSRLNSYANKQDQLAANLGWCFAANNAIVDPTAAVELKLYKIQKDGDRVEIKQHEILDLLDAPNLAHTGEQMRHLHFTYMNYVGESYIHMLGIGATDFEPGKGKLPLAMEIFPAHLVDFKLEGRYMSSVVKYQNHEYPLTSFIRDLNPDPERPYYGRSIVRAGALAIGTDNEMKKWNENLFGQGAHPSLIFNTNEPLSDAAYERWKQQFADEHTGTENAHKPLLIEGGDAKPYMMSPTDLDFLASREFSMKEILSMWRVSPDLLGQLQSAIRSNLDGAFYMNGMINVVPRIRQFVKQLNATLIKPYDPTLELDFVNPVPEDVAAKLEEAVQSANKFRTIDEVRDMYGEQPLPDKLGEQIYMANLNAPLSSIADGTAKPTASPAAAAAADDPPADGTTDPADAAKSHNGVKKNS